VVQVTLGLFLYAEEENLLYPCLIYMVILHRVDEDKMSYNQFPNLDALFHVYREVLESGLSS
jgi:hypothetical protein